MEIIRVDTLDNLIEDVASYLGISPYKLLDVLAQYSDCSFILNTDCYQYIAKHKKYTLREFYLCHVAAKLDCEHMELLPLEKLLTTQNSFSNFLLEHGIKFERSQNSRRKLDLFYKGKLIKYGNSRIKDRFSEDLCVNGYQFLYDITSSAQDYNEYCSTPEFLQDLDRLLGNDLLNKFQTQSQTYVALCRVPKGKIVFDTNVPVQNFEERYIYSAMEYIWKYWKGGSGYNPALRALDTDTVKIEKWVPEKEIKRRR